MPVFKCAKCGVMENTAVCHYWTRKKGSPPICSVCDPGIGKWHGLFARQKPEKFGLVEGPDGFIYAPDDPYLKKLVEGEKK